MKDVGELIKRRTRYMQLTLVTAGIAIGISVAALVVALVA